MFNWFLDSVVTAADDPGLILCRETAVGMVCAPEKPAINSNSRIAIGAMPRQGDFIMIGFILLELVMFSWGKCRFHQIRQG